MLCAFQCCLHALTARQRAPVSSVFFVHAGEAGNYGFSSLRSLARGSRYLFYDCIPPRRNASAGGPSETGREEERCAAAGRYQILPDNLARAPCIERANVCSRGCAARIPVGFFFWEGIYENAFLLSPPFGCCFSRWCFFVLIARFFAFYCPERIIIYLYPISSAVQPIVSSPTSPCINLSTNRCKQERTYSFGRIKKKKLKKMPINIRLHQSTFS